VSLLKDVKNLYAGLTATAITERTIGKTLSNRDLEDTLAETNEHGLQIPDTLSDDELKDIMDTNGIPTQGPKVLLLSGASAARAINHTMDSEKIAVRNDENLKIIREYVNTYHPDVAGQVEIANGLAWPEATNEGEASISNYTRTVMDYLADVLDKADEPEIKHAVDNLKKRGERRGGEAGKKGSMLYAASHPKFFNDRLNLPFGKMLDRKGKQPRMVISLGGKTEKQFDIARDYLSTHASVEGFQAHLWDSAIPQAETFEEAQELVGFYWASKKWQEMTEQFRSATYTNDAHKRNLYEHARTASSFKEQYELLEQMNGYLRPPLTTRADLPEFGTIQFLVNIGKNATYYANPEVTGHVYSNGVHEPRIELKTITVDQPYGTVDVDQQLARLRAELAGLKKASETDKEVKKANLLPIEHVEGAVYDLDALSKSMANTVHGRN
jgi:hypothetical protein